MTGRRPLGQSNWLGSPITTRKRTSAWIRYWTCATWASLPRTSIWARTRMMTTRLMKWSWSLSGTSWRLSGIIGSRSSSRTIYMSILPRSMAPRLSSIRTRPICSGPCIVRPRSMRRKWGISFCQKGIALKG